jgi:hypothetical protein
MTANLQDLHRIRSERALCHSDYDVTAKFMAVGHLRGLAGEAEPGLAPTSLAALERLLRDTRIRRQSQAYFLYYEGFVDHSHTDPFPVSAADLSGRMIEEMGVDRHMEEIFRIADQRELSDAQFRAFLMHRGYTPKEAAAAKRGEADISLMTGPHLGGFNQRISLPELIHAVETFSASCVAGRYWKSRKEG